MEREIKKTLKDLGIRPDLKGYWYISESILYLLEHGKNEDTTVHSLYIAIAEKNNVAWTSVERCIRKCIERMFDSCGIDRIFDIFGESTRISKGILTNKEFLWTLAEHFYDSREEGCESENETTDCEMEGRILQFADYADCVT